MDGRVAERGPRQDEDDHAWRPHQAAPLRAGDVGLIDAAGVAGALEGMARRGMRDAVPCMDRLFRHPLEFRFQPERASRSWPAPIRNAPAEPAGMFEWRALRRAAIEAGLPLRSPPADNPRTLDEALAWAPPDTLSPACDDA